MCAQITAKRREQVVVLAFVSARYDPGEIWREVFSIKIGVKLSSPPKKKRGQDDFRKNSDKVDPRDIA